MIEIKAPNHPIHPNVVHIDGIPLPGQLIAGTFIQEREGILEVDCYMIANSHDDHTKWPYQRHAATMRPGKQHRIITYYFNLSKLKR